MELSNHLSAKLCLGVIVITLAACGSAPKKNAALDRANEAYEAAKSNPLVTANAQDALEEAGKRIRTANDAFSQAGSNAQKIANVEHLAYLAEQEVNIAVLAAERKDADQMTEKLVKMRDELRLKAREKEAEKARMEAEKRAREAEMAREQAEMERRQAELERQRTEEAKAQAEQSAREAQEAKAEAEQKAKEAEEALARARELEQQLAELQAKQTDRGMVLTLGDVLFETGKANLVEGAARNLDKLVEFLKENEDRQLLIEGHTDNVGGAEYNMRLSERRADAVKSALVGTGVGDTRISTKGYGETLPVASNDSESGRQQNRRVEIVILNP
ncbi:MAG: OmpA family protein [Pseudomonadota bacterium]